MAKVSIELDVYDKPISVDAYEGLVHLDARIEDGDPSLRPDEARALAAVLTAQAVEAERTPPG